MRYQACAAFVFAGEDEDRITLADVLATLHRLLFAECVRRCLPVVDSGFDRKHFAPVNAHPAKMFIVSIALASTLAYLQHPSIVSQLP